MDASSSWYSAFLYVVASCFSCLSPGLRGKWADGCTAGCTAACAPRSRLSPFRTRENIFELAHLSPPPFSAVPVLAVFSSHQPPSNRIVSKLHPNLGRDEYINSSFFLCSGAGGAAAKAAPFTADCAFGCARLVCSRLCNQLAATAPLSCKPPSLSNRSVFICPSTNLSTGAPQGQRLVAQ